MQLGYLGHVCQLSTYAGSNMRNYQRYGTDAAAGTTAASLRAGVSALILWVGLDHPLWAAAVERLKVGSARSFPATTPDSLGADLRAILTPECLTRARDVAAQMTTCAAT
jgi:UDP:flavonoid glycosyltransferase YjiC (YdhE family)